MAPVESASSKKLRTTAAGAAAAAPVHPPIAIAFESLPDALHRAISAYLSKARRLAVSRTCKALLVPYGGHFGELEFVLPEYVAHVSDAGPLRRFLTRQEALVTLRVVDDDDLVSAVCDAIKDGAGRRLQDLTFYTRNRLWVDDPGAASLASLFRAEPDAMPCLEALTIDGHWPGIGGLDSFLEALGQGKAPRLRSLSLHVRRGGMAAGFLMHQLAAALESRRAAGCAGLAFLCLGRCTMSLSWLTGAAFDYKNDGAQFGGPIERAEGAAEGHRRLLAAVLPSVEAITQSMVLNARGAFGGFHEAVKEHGAPRLRMLSVTPETACCLPFLTNLESLTVDTGRADVVMDALLAAPSARRTLRTIKLISFGADLVGWGLGALAASIAGGGFPALRKLIVCDDDLTNKGLCDFLSHFSARAPLSLEKLGLHLKRIGDTGVAALTSALQTGRLGSRLQKLWICPEAGITDMGTRLLRQAFKNGRANVERLQVLYLHMEGLVGKPQLEDLVYDVIAACPALKCLHLAGVVLDEREKARLVEAAGERGPEVLEIDCQDDDAFWGDGDADSAGGVSDTERSSGSVCEWTSE